MTEHGSVAPALLLLGQSGRVGAWLHEPHSAVNRVGAAAKRAERVVVLLVVTVAVVVVVLSVVVVVVCSQ